MLSVFSQTQKICTEQAKIATLHKVFSKFMLCLKACVDFSLPSCTQVYVAANTKY